MMNVFVVVPYDLPKLESLLDLGDAQNGTVLSRLHAFTANDLVILQQANRVYFVVSETSLCSTAFQMLLHDNLSLIQAKDCRVFRLDDTPIPSGFPMLQSLPIG